MPWMRTSGAPEPPRWWSKPMSGDYAAATITRRMPSINQLVRKGRTKPRKKVSTPGLKSGQGRKKRIAAPQRRGVCTRVYHHAEEAELRAAQGRARPADQRHGGHGLHPR